MTDLLTGTNWQAWPQKGGCGLENLARAVHGIPSHYIYSTIFARTSRRIFFFPYLGTPLSCF